VSNIDQRRIDNQHSDSELISAREAAAMLDVKLPTLYAYVSRGLIRSVRGPAGRPRRYARADVARLVARREARKGHRAVAAGALRWGEPVLDSAITEITESGARYRGHPAVELARSRSFESVAELLWTESLPDDDMGWTVRAPRLPRAALASLIPADTPPIAVLSAVVPLLAVRDDARYDAADAAEVERAKRILLSMPRALASAKLPADLGVAELTARALGARPTAKRLAAVDAVLVLTADHELNVSALAARVAASAGADLYACVAAALAALSGPRHGGVCDRVEALIRECKRPSGARAVVRGRTRRGEPIPGFGHPLYPDGDPRARAMLSLARKLAPRANAVRTADALVAAMRDADQEPPTMDLGLVAVAGALGMRPGSAAALFAIGRAAGWIAHVFEQRRANFMVRPRARYIGVTVDART
jgi:citrate synthase